MSDFRVIIAGCRDFYNYVTLKERCEYYLQNKMKTHNVIIISGHAAGNGGMFNKAEKAHEKAIEKLKKKAAKLKCGIVLITSDSFGGQWNNISSISGEAYK